MFVCSSFSFPPPSQLNNFLDMLCYLLFSDNWVTTRRLTGILHSQIVDFFSWSVLFTEEYHLLVYSVLCLCTLALLGVTATLWNSIRNFMLIHNVPKHGGLFSCPEEELKNSPNSSFICVSEGGRKDESCNPLAFRKSNRKSALVSVIDFPFFFFSPWKYHCALHLSMERKV